MTEVNITTVKNTVEVIEDVNNVIEVNVGTNNVAEVAVAGPQGPGFELSLNHANKVNNSIMYYQQSSDTLRLDATRTVENLVDGGNF